VQQRSVTLEKRAHQYIQSIPQQFDSYAAISNNKVTIPYTIIINQSKMKLGTAQSKPSPKRRVTMQGSHLQIK
jgi:hypothetical protein